MTLRSSRPITAVALVIACCEAMGAADSKHPRRELSQFATEMVAAHNAYRAPLKIPPLKWSDKLAADAQAWADTLAKKHAFYHQRQSSEGENLFSLSGTGTATPDDVVHDWAAESLDYDYRSNACHSTCGHYTQIVWRSTSEVGCAVSHAASYEVWVCRYSPPGNVVGQRPY